MNLYKNVVHYIIWIFEFTVFPFSFCLAPQEWFSQMKIVLERFMPQRKKQQQYFALWSVYDCNACEQIYDPNYASAKTRKVTLRRVWGGFGLTQGGQNSNCALFIGTRRPTVWYPCKMCSCTISVLFNHEDRNHDTLAWILLRLIGLIIENRLNWKMIQVPVITMQSLLWSKK